MVFGRREMKESELTALLQDMSLDEKVNQLVQLQGVFYNPDSETGCATGPTEEMGLCEQQVWEAGSILTAVGAANLRRIQKNYMEHQPHHIPLLFMADIINGYRTIFPIPLAQGCSFDPELVSRMASAAAKESARTGLHVTFSPMADLVRDARWGRVMEATGEDTFLNCCMAKAMVEGYQGGDVARKDKIAACIKHLAGYGAPVGGRDYNQVELSERTLREEYLPAYKAGVEAGAEMVMTSFNTLERIPSTANKKLMRDILRGEWKFNGVVISDWGAVGELVEHGIAEDKDEAAYLAMRAGVDIDMMTEVYANHLKQLVEKGKVPEKWLDEAVYRILRLKNRLGLFENPYKDADEEYDEKTEIEPAHRQLAREAAAETFVLLKNDGILPLKKKPDEECRSIAFIGPYTKCRQICGSWSLFKKVEDCVTLEEGVRAKQSEMPVSFEMGCGVLEELRGTDRFAEELENAGTPEELEELTCRAVEAAKKADIVVMPLGEHYDLSGEGASKTEICLPPHQVELFDRIFEVNPNIVVVSFSGRPMDIRAVCDRARAILHVWLPGSEGGNAIADVLFGDKVPCGKLSMCFPYNVGQVPVYYSELHTGRRRPEGKEAPRYVSSYRDAPNRPLFAFGYGLSYTDFSYSEIHMDGNILKPDGKVTASVIVTNTGKTAGKEVVQLYIHDVAGSVARPVRELKGFQKILLQPGESREVSFEIREEMLRFYTVDMKYASEPGKFELFIGGDSDTDNRAEFSLV